MDVLKKINKNNIITITTNTLKIDTPKRFPANLLELQGLSIPHFEINARVVNQHYNFQKKTLWWEINHRLSKNQK